MEKNSVFFGGKRQDARIFSAEVSSDWACPIYGEFTLYTEHVHNNTDVKVVAVTVYIGIMPLTTNHGAYNCVTCTIEGSLT